ncbi:MAG: haloacid dehalogenase-like hydrolase [Chlorobi bacterium]|nr:haloacid dehalogenase-like hydrolase [Chlorobiota bacterium]
MKKKALVVDLDGTLFSINTFHYFIKYLIRFCLRNIDMILLIKISVIVISRGLKIISHSKMKYLILMRIRYKILIDYQEFVGSISFAKRDLLLLKKRSFDITILATAAPSCYAKIIAKNECFDLCLGTEFPITNFNTEYENSKEVKKMNVMNYLMKDDIYEIDTFITDHLDDIPLMKLSRRNIIVNPNRYTKKELKRHNISFEVL